MYSSNLRRPSVEVRDDQLTIKHVVKNFPLIPRFRFSPYTPMPKNENAESAESLIKFLSTYSGIFTE